jgi:hypothetical protein
VSRRWAHAAAIAIGAGDAVTGALLVAAPDVVLLLLRIAAPAAPATIFLRWIGVFVLAVGAAYLLPFAAEEPERSARLRGAVAWTALARLSVTTFVSCAVLAGALGTGWCFVGTYDGLLAVAQLALVARGAFGEAAPAGPRRVR